MGLAGAAAKIATKPGVLGAILGAAGGIGAMGLLGGGGSTEQTTTQTPTGGTTYNTTHTQSNTYSYDYSSRVQTTNVIDSPFASVDPGMSGGLESRIIPTNTTSTDAGSAAKSTASAPGGGDLLPILAIGGLALGGLYIVFGGKK